MSDFIASQGLGQQPCGSRDEADSPATAALATAPDDWALVPRETTDAMARAWWRSHFSDDPVPGGRTDQDAYAAMLAAAPPAPAWIGIDDDFVNRVATAAMVCVTPHLKHMISFTSLCEAVSSALGATASTLLAGGKEEVAAPVIQQPREDQKSASPQDRIDVEGLKAAAEKATPGKWVPDRALTYMVRVEEDGYLIGNDFHERDQRFVALANPATILALLAERAELIAQRAALVEGLSQAARNLDVCAEVIGKRYKDGRHTLAEGWAERARALLSTIQATWGGE